MPNNQMKLLVRADAGPSVGTGHVLRSIALGQAWKQIGGEVAFVCGALPRGLIKRIGSEKFRLHQILNDRCDAADARETRQIASEVQPDWIAIDGHRFNDTYQQGLRAKRYQLLVLDDFHDSQHPDADLILNQNVDTDLSQYKGTRRSKVLSGSKFALLRTEFSQFNTAKRIAAEAKRLLVTFGGADPDNWTLRTLQVLSDLNRKRLVVDCVIGACYPHVAELEMFKKSANMSLRIHRNVDRMDALMAKVDLAITAGGSTCYELARCGVPSVVTSISDHQLPVARSMNEQGAMISIDGTEPLQSACQRQQRLSKAIRKLINSSQLREEMSKRGRRLVDGNGGQRIVRQMAALMYPFRTARADDMQGIWAWRNDPEVRSVSFDQHAIPLDQHRQWFQQQLNDPRSEIWVAENLESQPVGLIGIEQSSDGQTRLIRLIVDQALRGRGLGTILIASAAKEIFERTSARQVIAQIKPGNVASEKAFRAAGFSAIQPAVVNGKMALQFVLERDSSAAIDWSFAKKSA